MEISKEKLKNIFIKMYTIRKCEETLAKAAQQGLVFGGSEMNILFVTSASVGKNIDEDVHAGNLFSITTNKKGVPSPHFG